MKDVYLEIISKLKNDESFDFVRYGDGEWALIFRNEVLQHLIKKWGDSVEPFSDVLRNIIESKPKYYIGIQNMAYNLWKTEIEEMTSDLNTVKGDIFHKKSQNGDIKEFFDVLCNKNVVIVGPEYLSKIKEFNYFHHIITDEYYVWNQIDKLDYEIEKFIDSNKHKNFVFLYSCSLAAKVLINKYSNSNNTQIDTGSLLDPYVGCNSRSYHKSVLDRIGFKESEIKVPKIK